MAGDGIPGPGAPDVGRAVAAGPVDILMAALQGGRFGAGGGRGVREAVAAARRPYTKWLPAVISLLDGIQHGWAAAVAVSPELTHLAVGTREGSICLLDFDAAPAAAAVTA